METYEYKEDIRNTRVNCVGGSDAKMLSQIAALGVVPRSAYRRLAICKGLIQNDEHPTTAAMRAGDIIENTIYEHLAQGNKNYQSNPRWESKKYRRNNVRLISHPDFVFEDKDTKTIFVYECKCTKYDIKETRETYREQLYVEYTMAKERAMTMGRGWKVKLYLVHYDTNGLDIGDGVCPFDVDRMSVVPVSFTSKVFDIDLALDIIDRFLDDMEVYYEEDEVNADLLPERVYAQFDNACRALNEIKRLEQGVDAFKEKIYNFMKKNNITSIKNDVFTISRVDAGIRKTFDAKTYLRDYEMKHPTKYKRIMGEYQITSTVKGHVKIRIKNNDNN